MEIERLPLGQSQADKRRDTLARWIGAPPGLPPEFASKFILGLHGGKTISDMTHYGDDHICSHDRFQKHCELNPEWGVEARRLSLLNYKTRASIASPTRGLKFEFCASGRHRMDGSNVVQSKTRPTNRYCRACRGDKLTRPLTAEEIAAVKHAVSVEKRNISNITTGRPMGGGKTDYSKAIVYGSRLVAHYKRDSEFHSFIQEHITGNIARGNVMRHVRRKTQIQISAARDARTDYHKIRDMISEGNPHRDDIVARIFEDILMGTLKREEVPTRLKVYISELNKLYPTQYRKFGDSLLVSLDEVLFEDGTTTRGDNVSRGLWD